MLNNYVSSKFYKNNYDFWRATWRKGTKKFRNDISAWRTNQKYLKKYAAEVRKSHQSTIKDEIKKLDIKSTEEEIDNFIIKAQNNDFPTSLWWFVD